MSNRRSRRPLVFGNEFLHSDGRGRVGSVIEHDDLHLLAGDGGRHQRDRVPSGNAERGRHIGRRHRNADRNVSQRGGGGRQAAGQRSVSFVSSGSSRLNCIDRRSGFIPPHPAGSPVRRLQSRKRTAFGVDPHHRRHMIGSRQPKRRGVENLRHEAAVGQGRMITMAVISRSGAALGPVVNRASTEASPTSPSAGTRHSSALRSAPVGQSGISVRAGC